MRRSQLQFSDQTRGTSKVNHWLKAVSHSATCNLHIVLIVHVPLPVQSPRCTTLSLMGTTDIDKPWSTAPDHTRDGTTTDIPALRAAYVTQPVICYLPAPRDAPRFLSLPQIDPVEQTQPHPDPVQELAARAYLTKPRSHAVRSSSPCGVLPVELLREIFSYAIGDPSNHRGIMRISCVCEFWRAVVTDAPGFFIRANWDSWPSWLLESWCSRANGQPLTIQLGELGSTKALQPSQSEYRRVLQSTKAAWECLEVQIGHITTSERDVLGSLLFDDELPSLRRLRVAVPRWSSLTYPTIIPIRADLPTLQHLVLDGVAVRPFKQSLTLTHITINLSSSLSWSEWTQNIQLFAGITNLALTNIRPGNLLGHSLLELPSLTELLLESSPNDRTISSLFRSISIPNAHSVTLRDIVYYSNSDVLVALVSISMASPSRLVRSMNM